MAVEKEKTGFSCCDRSMGPDSTHNNSVKSCSGRDHPSQLPLLKLLQEGASYLKVRSAGVYVFERLHQGPVKLLHQVDANDTTGSTLASNRVNQDAVKLVSSFIDEVLNLVGHLIIIIKKKLPIVIKPVKRQVFNTNGRPLIL